MFENEEYSVKKCFFNLEYIDRHINKIVQLFCVFKI